MMASINGEQSRLDMQQDLLGVSCCGDRYGIAATPRLFRSNFPCFPRTP
jgi:hypothetical protein